MKLLAFGVTRDIIGKGESVKTLNDTITVFDLKSQLFTEFPKLKELNTLAVAVNETYATDDVEINDGDEVALIPPVSGG